MTVCCVQRDRERVVPRYTNKRAVSVTLYSCAQGACSCSYVCVAWKGERVEQGVKECSGLWCRCTIQSVSHCSNDCNALTTAAAAFVLRASVQLDSCIHVLCSVSVAIAVSATAQSRATALRMRRHCDTCQCMLPDTVLRCHDIAHSP